MKWIADLQAGNRKVPGTPEGCIMQSGCLPSHLRSPEAEDAFWRTTNLQRG